MQTKYEKAKELFTKIRNIPSDHLEITFQMTDECNFRCSYCYEKKKSTKLDIKNAFAVIDKLFDIEDYSKWWGNFLCGTTTKDFITFNFFGGECFLEVDNMEAICQYFVDKCNTNSSKYAKRLNNFRIICQSNASLFTTEKVRTFIDKWYKRLGNNFIMFATIDGSKEQHDACRVFKDTNKGTYDLVKSNIEWYRDNYRLPQTKGTIGPDTIQYLFESYKSYRELGYNNILTTLRCDCEWPKESLKIANEQFKLISEDLLKPENLNVSYATFNSLFFNRTEHVTWGIGTCGSNGASFAVDSSGNLYLCFAFTELAQDGTAGNHDEVIIGNVKDGFSQKGEEFISKVKTMVDKPKYTDEKCTQCIQQKECEFCPAFTYKASGNVENDLKRACAVKKIEQYWALVTAYKKEKMKQ